MRRARTVVAGLALLTVTFGGWPTSSAQTQTASPADRPETPSNVAVLDFRVIGSGIDPSVGEALASVIRSALVRGGGVRLIERAELASVLTEQNLQVTDIVDPVTAVQAGRIAGVDRLVLGSVASVQNTYTVTCQMIDVTTGEAAQAEEFGLSTLENYPQLGRLLAALIGEQPIGQDSIARPPHLTESFAGRTCTLKLGLSERSQSGAVLEKGQYVMVKTNPGNQYSWVPKVEAGFHFRVDLAQLEGPPNSGCGLVWGAQGKDAYLSVWVNGQRGARIERRQGGTSNTGLVRKRDWPVLHKPPRGNRIRVESWNDRHRVFINGVCVDDFYEPGFRGGRVGLRVLQRQESTPARWAADNLTVGVIDPTLAGIAGEPVGVVGPDSGKLRKKRVAGTTKPWARFHKIWITRERRQKTKGITVHAAFEVGNRKGAKLRAVAQFYDAKTGKPLKDRDKRYRGADGKVMADRLLSPRHRVSTYSDLGLFIPVDQLHAPRGTSLLKCRIVLLDVSQDRSTALARSNEIAFRPAK